MDVQLLNLLGQSSYASAAKAFGKSVDALRKRAKRLGIRLDQGTVTLRELARATGYDRHQLRRAAKKLNQKWTRATTRKLLITSDYADAMVNYLKHER